jgi:hypothetical protein
MAIGRGSGPRAAAQDTAARAVRDYAAGQGSRGGLDPQGETSVGRLLVPESNPEVRPHRSASATTRDFSAGAYETQRSLGARLTGRSAISLIGQERTPVTVVQTLHLPAIQTCERSMCEAAN